MDIAVETRKSAKTGGNQLFFLGGGGNLKSQIHKLIFQLGHSERSKK